MEKITVPIIGIERLRMKTDGDGIRTLIGFKGCPLRCKYCLNPHSWNEKTAPEIYTAENLYEEVRLDSLYFIATSGGITFGGGEPLLYADFIAEFKKLCPKEWNIWAETSLYVPKENIEKLATVIDKFVVDIKTLDKEVYKQYTGGDVDLVVSNLQWLIENAGQEKIVVRAPVIPGYADENMQKKTVNELKEMGICDIDIFEYSTGI